MTDGVTFQPLISIVPQQEKPKKSLVTIVVVVTVVFNILLVGFTIYLLVKNRSLEDKIQHLESKGVRVFEPL
jgi:hypothetical protein